MAIHLEIGQEINGYRILDVLAEGGMGVLYKAEDMGLSRTVVLKTILPTFLNSEHSVARFRREAQLLAKTASPNIVAAYALVDVDDGMFISMEYVQGGDLADLLEHEIPSVDRAIDIICQVLTGLEHAHGVNVIHRDIKPRNIMLSDDGRVKLTDFGLAKDVQTDMQLTQTHATVGTSYYMAPEQIRAEPLDERTDIWSVGVVLFEMLSGRRPFDGSYQQAVQYGILNEDPILPPEIASKIPDQLERVLMKALSKEPEGRYRDAASMRRELESVSLHKESGNTSTDRERRPLLRRHRVAAGFILVGFLVSVGYFLSRDSSPPTLAATGSEPAERTDMGLKQPTDLMTAVPDAGGQPMASISGASTPLDSTPPEILESTTATQSSENASLVLHAIPGATVTIDGGPTRTLGTTSLTPGHHTVRFVSPLGDEIEQSVYLESGSMTSITCYFEGIVSINAEPVWATVWIDGENIEETTPTQITLDTGTHSVDVRRFGYATLGGAESVLIAPNCDEQPKFNLAFQLSGL